jgi:hypothetical protein
LHDDLLEYIKDRETTYEISGDSPIGWKVAHEILKVSELVNNVLASSNPE